MQIDPGSYNLTKEQARAVEILSPDQLEYAYRIRKRLYLIEDAERHAEVLLSSDPDLLNRLTPEDFENMASRFEDGFDAGTDENTLWDDVVWAYVNREED